MSSAFESPFRLSSVDGARSAEFTGLVDTGASYTIVPGSMLRGLGIEPVDTITLTMADGRRAELPIGEARAGVDGRDAFTLVVFGPDEARALLGAYTLEGLRLAVDPVQRRLVPIATAWA